MMRIKTTPRLLLLVLLLLSVSNLFAQGRPYEGPDDPAGDPAFEREGYMTGNRVLLYFQNTTELSAWQKPNVSRWPNNSTGTKMTDGIGLLIGAKVYIKDTDAAVDTIPLTDWAQILSNDHHVLYYLQTSYREEMDNNPTGDVEWGLFPVEGYSNLLSEYPAMSHLPDSWPDGWPALGGSLKWPGEWNGRFGRGVIYADMESYFVVNDAQDQEYLGVEDPVRYYPRPGKTIQADATQQPGAPWGGLGIRVSTRGFQWNNPQARDAIFWEYNIANTSDYDLREVAFGYWVDNAIGHSAVGGSDGDDEKGYFDDELDMSYSWDVSGRGVGNLKTGTLGFAYLESPGVPNDFLDNDDDGMTNERRDNIPTAIVGPLGTITDLDKFLNFYNLTEADLRDHWDADEDQDWEDGIDTNGDGVYQINEYAGDDVGLDGVAPGELNYFGPDEGEGDHMPSFREGVGCEPNFNLTDVSESDMVGLTAFQMFPVPSHSQSNTTLWFKNDQAMFNLIASDTLEEYTTNTSNLIEVFASGTFPLDQGLTERISMSELHSFDDLDGLNSDEHRAPALYELKKIVQVIYEKDYRFAQPPKMPTLTATAGDGRVVLTWDDIADTRTRDPFVGNVNDFEGYKVYRSTDKFLSDPEIITDGFGQPTFKTAIFQCDLKDGIQGFTDFGLLNGAAYYLGSETGITHRYIDNSVQNGRTYYYAVVAYDYGAEDIGPGIAPSENNAVIELDEAEEVRAWGKNVAIMTPRQTAAGYVPPEIELSANEDLLGNGVVEPEILSTGGLQTNHEYLVTFDIDTIKQLSGYEHGLFYSTSAFYIYDVTDTMSLAYYEDAEQFSGENMKFIEGDSLNLSQDYEDFTTLNPNGVSSDVFDGLQVRIDLSTPYANYNYAGSGWLTGNGLINIVPSVLESRLMAWDYEIIFTDNDSAYVGKNRGGSPRDADGTLVTLPVLRNQAFNFYVQNTSFVDTLGQYEKFDMVVVDLNQNGVYDKFEDKVLVGPLDPVRQRWKGTVFSIDFRYVTEASFPQADDVYKATFNRPFFKTDSIRFTVNSTDELDVDHLRTKMDSIQVVPNPYVVTNMMETAVANPFLNQRRKLMFTHIPAECTIHIFTVSGTLVDRIDVENADAQNGIIHWDMLTREGLEIAAGMYIYHIESTQLPGETKTGKFAVIK
jgi:hypothetical protein